MPAASPRDDSAHVQPSPGGLTDLSMSSRAAAPKWLSSHFSEWSQPQQEAIFVFIHTFPRILHQNVNTTQSQSLPYTWVYFSLPQEIHPWSVFPVAGWRCSGGFPKETLQQLLELMFNILNENQLNTDVSESCGLKVILILALSCTRSWNYEVLQPWNSCSSQH